MAAPRHGPRSRQMASAQAGTPAWACAMSRRCRRQQARQGLDRRPEHVRLAGEEIEPHVGDAGATQPLSLRRPVAAAARAAGRHDGDLGPGGPLRLRQAHQRAAGAAPQERGHVDDAPRPPPRGSRVRHARIVACGTASALSLLRSVPFPAAAVSSRHALVADLRSVRVARPVHARRRHPRRGAARHAGACSSGTRTTRRWPAWPPRSPWRSAPSTCRRRWPSPPPATAPPTACCRSAGSCST